jgi:hypothetical protein
MDGIMHVVVIFGRYLKFFFFPPCPQFSDVASIAIFPRGI